MSDISDTFVAFPPDKMPPDRPDERIAVYWALDESIRSVLVKTGDQLGASLPDVTLAGLIALLHRQSAQSTIVIGCIDTSGIRLVHVDVPDKVTFSQLIELVLSARKDSRGTAVLAEHPRGLPCFSFVQGLTADQNRGEDFCLSITDQGTGLALRVQFSAQQYGSDRMRDLVEQYALLVGGAARSPSSEITDISLITALGHSLIPDPHVVLEKPRYKLLTEAFLEVANASPAAVAIRHQGRQWTYGQLRDSATALACHLRAQGISESSVVAVSGRRGFAVVSSMLGTLMSAGVLMTIDPHLPADRQKSMLAQSRAQIIICVGNCPELSDCGLRIIRIDDADGKIVDLDVGAPAPPLPKLSPAAPAYIFFTSGSTGVPKAVLGSHAGLAHFLDWQRKTFDVQRGDRAAQITALSFDVVLRDIFLALTAGATLSIPADGDILDPAAILSWMATEEITILHIVPTLLLAWVNNAPDGLELPRLRLVFLAGEPLLDVLLKGFRARFGDNALLNNFYGPTESTLAKCFHTIRTIEPGLQPVGRPQPQTQVLILNSSRKLCGLNEPGEIAIRTPFRTLGYLNAPEATAKVFVPNPFRNDPDDLIYLTGDRGRYRLDGLVEVQGRIDNQVKIRGVRIEPGEIEAVLSTHPAVKQAAVAAHADESGTKYLVGYVVLRNGEDRAAPPDVLGQIRTFVRSKLPDSMVPSEIVALPNMPLLPNGKVNRKALLPPERASLSPGATTAMSPSPEIGEQEASLLAVWRSVLGHSRVTVDDSFIELGGDSLSAMTVLVRMRRLGIPDTVARGIFQGWSIRQIIARSAGAESPTDTPGTRQKVRINQLVNAIRGILVAILVFSHWYEGLLNALPVQLRSLQPWLDPVLNIATPGFALIFGLGTGYIFYPRFATEASQVRRSMRLGFLLVTAGIVISALVGLARDFMESRPVDSTEFFNKFYSALLYYALALLTVPLWFRMIAGGEKPFRRVVVMVLSAYALHRVGQWILLPREQQGFLQLCRLMLVAKFNYLNMSVGALSGVGAGIYLARWAAENRSLRALAPRMLLVGLLLVGAGTAITFLTYGGWEGINESGEMPISRWVFYAGVVLLIMSALALILTAYERIPWILRECLNVTSVLGQLSLPIFVLHRLVLQARHLLMDFGLPKWPALGIPVILFAGFCWWSMSKLYRLYYAKV